MPSAPPRPAARLPQQERHARILAMLRRDGIVRIATLAKSFDVTTETARRDLDELAESGALQRTYGGGASRSLTTEPGIGLRGLVHAQERRRIAAAAAALVEPGDALFVDAGSTTSLFAAALAIRNLPLTVVTNCLPVATSLGAVEHCRVILCPGDYVPREGAVFGTEAVAFLGRYKANRAFVGAGGVFVDVSVATGVSVMPRGAYGVSDAASGWEPMTNRVIPRPTEREANVLRFMKSSSSPDHRQIDREEQWHDDGG
jgi:DeoR/GlpR family transcriptional regulator of sugar metabolism